VFAEAIASPQLPTPGTDDGALVSMYVRLSRVFRDRIAQGEWPAGSLLPPLPELCREYNVARVTVRQALGLLSARGLIVARRGIGTVVVHDAATALGHAGLRRAINDPAESNSLSIEVLRRDAVGLIPADLGGHDGGWRHWRKRHRHESVPFVLMDLYVRHDIASLFPKRADTRLKLVQLLRQHHPVPNLREEVTMTHASPEVSAAMECPLGEALVRMRRWYSDEQGAVVMAGTYLYRADRFVLEIRRDLAAVDVSASVRDGGSP